VIARRMGFVPVGLGLPVLRLPGVDVLITAWVVDVGVRRPTVRDRELGQRVESLVQVRLEGEVRRDPKGVQREGEHAHPREEPALGANDLREVR
jgi:hypothetical protein